MLKQEKRKVPARVAWGRWTATAAIVGIAAEACGNVWPLP